MREELLRDLLRQSFPRPAPSPAACSGQQLLEQIRRRRRRRAVRRATMVTIGSLSIVLGGWLGGVRIVPLRSPPTGISADTASHDLSGGDQRPSVSSPATDDFARAINDADRLQQEIAVQRQVVQGLEDLHRLAQARAQLAEVTADAPPQPLHLDALYQRHRAAALALLYADRLLREPRRRDEALAQYTWVAEHFPGTAWADRAKTRIEQLPPPL